MAHGRPRLYPKDAVKLRIVIPRGVYDVLVKRAKTTMRSASLVARELLLSAFHRKEGARRGGEK